MAGIKAISADSHVQESPELFETRVPEEFQGADCLALSKKKTAPNTSSPREGTRGGSTSQRRTLAKTT